MFVWLKKDCNNTLADVVISLDPPDPAEDEHWIMLTTREFHFENICNELEKLVKEYEKQNDYRAARVAKDLSKELRRQTTANVMVN